MSMNNFIVYQTYEI